MVLSLLRFHPTSASESDADETDMQGRELPCDIRGFHRTKATLPEERKGQAEGYDYGARAVATGLTSPQALEQVAMRACGAGCGWECCGGSECAIASGWCTLMCGCRLGCVCMRLWPSRSTR